GIDRHVAGAGDDNPLPVERAALGAQHLLDEEDRAVTGRLTTHLGPAPTQPLAGEHRGLIAVGDALVLAEQVADLAPADSDVTRGDVGVLADVAVELGHEGLAEPHDLHVGATFGVEVRAALAPADRQAGEGVLEDLLETEELDRVQQNARVEAQASLVGAERRVELHAETSVDLDLAPVIDPGHPEDDLPLRLAQAGNDARLAVVGVLADHGSETVQHLEDGLVELGLA